MFMRLSWKANIAAAAIVVVAHASLAHAQEVNPSTFQRPSGTASFAGQKAELVELGKKLWKAQNLGTNGQSCNTCHSNLNTYEESFRKPYPHFVQIVKDKSGADSVTAEEMVQFCVAVPLAGKLLAWDSKELAALTAYVGVRQSLFAQLKK